MGKINFHASKYINIRPIPKKRPRFKGSHAYMPQEYTNYKKSLHLLFGHVIDCDYYEVNIQFYRKMPKSWSKKKRDRMMGKWCKAGGDGDNLIGGVYDALFQDDSKIVQGWYNKRWWDDDAVDVEIKGWNDD